MNNYKRNADYKQMVLKVIRYIDEHQNQAMQINDLAKLAYFSPYHFHRIFHALVGEPVGKYIQRLRIEKATMLLKYTKFTITEIAYSSGYETPASFGKAFKNYFNLSPNEYRTAEKQLLSTNNHNPKKGDEMEIKMNKIDDIPLLCVRKTGEYSKAAKKAWDIIMPFAYANHLMNSSTKMIGISYDNPNITEINKLRYEACITCSNEDLVHGEIQKNIISGGLYAVFTHNGSYETISKTYNYIYGEWLIESKYHLRDAPCFEVYLNRNPQKTLPENLKTHIYLPIKSEGILC